MHHKIKPLMRKYEYDIHINDISGSKKEGEILALTNETEVLENDIKILRALNYSLQPAGELDKEKLNTLQRRQASMKRKQAELKMLIQQKKIECEERKKEMENIQGKRRVLYKKKKKYQHLFKLDLRKRHLKELVIAESETEEKIPWQK